MARPRFGLGSTVVTFFLGIVAFGATAKHGGAIVAIALIGAGVATRVWYIRKKYREDLIRRFGEVATVRILAGEIWQGATQPMVAEMLGAPADVASKVHKAKPAETWKYRRLAKNRYGLRVAFENGVCVGWEQWSGK